MCFSATASFVTAALTGVIGAAALIRVNEPRAMPLAAVPLLFAAQQSIEGLLWLNLPSAPQGPAATGLTILFLFVAEVFWPVYMPLAAWLIEPSRVRRRAMMLCLAIGLGISAYLLWWLVSRPHGAVIEDGHIVYVSESRHSDALGLAYLTATALPLLLSSLPMVAAFGAIVLAGSVTAYLLYWEAFVSVWCFFAAAASLVILFHFERSRRHRLATAAG